MDYTYIDTPDGIVRAAEELRGEPLLGIDTEAAGYHRYLDRLSLIQVSTRERHYLIDPFTVPDLSPLAEFFDDRSIEKIFHDADFDLRILDRDAGLRVAGLFDTQIAAAFLGERSLGLGAIVERFLGISLPKAFQRADWAERPLSEGMKDYAVTDTAHLPELRDRLREALVEKGRLTWAQEEFARREDTHWVQPESGDAFLRVKGARDLTPRGLAILRELHEWREAVGEERDQATFRVLSNQALIAMSLAPPRIPRDLREVPGLSPGLADRRGRDILAAVARGLAVPDDELPRFPAARRFERDPEAEARGEMLRGVRNQVAERLDLDPGFLMSRNVLDEIARRVPRSLDELRAIPDVRNWQVEAIGHDIIRALAG